MKDQGKTKKQLLNELLELRRRGYELEGLEKKDEEAEKIRATAEQFDLAVSGLNDRKGCEILGYREEEIIGKHWSDHFLPERDRERLSGSFAKLIAGDIEAVEYLENPVLTKSGEGCQCLCGETEDPF